MKKLLSITIILGVASAVFSIAGYIFMTSLSDEYSNIRVAGLLLNNLRNSHSTIAHDLSGEMLAMTTYIPIPSCDDVNPDGDCPVDGNETVIDCDVHRMMTRDGISVVNFLWERKMAFSLGYRKFLALKYNIPDYTGSTSQNRHLLEMLQQDLDAQCNSASKTGVMRTGDLL